MRGARSVRSRTASAGRDCRLQLAERLRQRLDGLEGRQREQRQHRDQDAVEPSLGVSLDGDREHADNGRARHEEAQCVAEAVGEGGPAGDADELRVGSTHRADAVPLESEGRKFRASGQRLDELGRQCAASPCVALRRSPRHGRRGDGHGDPAEQEPDSENERCGRKEEGG